MPAPVIVGMAATEAAKYAGSLICSMPTSLFPLFSFPIPVSPSNISAAISLFFIFALLSFVFGWDIPTYLLSFFDDDNDGDDNDGDNKDGDNKKDGDNTDDNKIDEAAKKKNTMTFNTSSSGISIVSSLSLIYMIIVIKVLKAQASTFPISIIFYAISYIFIFTYIGIIVKYSGKIDAGFGNKILRAGTNANILQLLTMAIIFPLLKTVICGTTSALGIT